MEELKKPEEGKKSLISSVISNDFMKNLASAINKKALEAKKKEEAVGVPLPPTEQIEDELLLLMRAEIRLYRGRRPTLEQMHRVEEKIKKIAKDKLKVEYKLKKMEEE